MIIMKVKNIRRVISLLLAFVMLMPLYVTAQTEVKAASKIVDITIDSVRRKYKESGSFLKLINNYRAENNLAAWEMDTELLELAMVKAAELSVYTDENNLDGSSFLDNDKQSRGLLIGYDVSNTTALLTSFKSEVLYSQYLKSTQFKAAGVGIVEVNKIKYVCVYVANKTPTVVDDDVLNQTVQTISQETRCKSEYLTDCVMNFKDNDQIVCGGNAVMRLLVHNQKFTDAYAYISGANTTITSSDTSVFKPNGDGTIVGLQPGTAIITMKLIGAPEISVSATLKAVAKTFAGCTISKVPDQYYTGTALTPTLSITSSQGTSLVIGKDYTLSYVNNIEVGTAVIKISGMGAYAGASATQSFQIINNPNAFSVALKSNVPSLEIGQTATLIATPANGTDPVKYKFEVAPQGTSSFSTLRSESTDNTYDYKPTAAGDYNLRVTAVDKNSKIATANITLNVSTAISISLNLSSTSLTLGNSLTIKAQASGGSSPYKYAYYVLEPGKSAYKAIASFGTLQTLTYKPESAGSYQLRCDVMGSNDVVSSTSKGFTVTSNNTTTDPLANNSTISATSVDLGTSLTLKGSASGGTSPYKYAYYYKLSSSSSYTVIGTEFGTSTSASYKPTAAGTYNFKVIVKDNSGSTAEKAFNVTVKNPTTPLSNYSSVSASSVSVGTAVKITGSASGGTTPYKYAYYYKLSTSSSWTAIGTEFSTATSATFTPSAAGTYSLKATVKDGSSATADKTFSLKVTAADPLANNSTISATNIVVGKSVTLTGKASGGTSPYKYAFYYKKSTDSSWTTSGTAFGTATTAAIKPEAAGTYNVKITAKDSTSATADKTFTLTVTAPLTNSSAISTTKVVVNNGVTLTGKASGGTSPYKYAFYYKKSTDSSWTTIGTAFGTATTATFKPTASGTYNVKATVKDNTSSTADKTFTVTAASAITNSSTVSSTKQMAGEKVTLTGKASGGVTPYKYAFYYKRTENTVWKVIGTEYGTSTTGVFQPTTTGTFDLKVNVKDNWGTVVSKTFKYTAIEPLVNNSTITSDKIPLGHSISVKAAATGGSGSYKYAFYYKKKESSTYTAIGTEYTTTSSVTFKPTAKGDYHIRISVKDTLGNEKAKALSLSVNDLQNNTTIVNTKVGLGTAFTINGSASGGTSPYTYAFYYKKDSDTSYTGIGTAYGTNRSAAFKAASVGKYTIKMSVKDKNGFISTKTASVRVTDLANNSTADYTKVGINNTVTFTGKASGGTAPYTYAFYYKRSENEIWKTIGTEFGTATTAKLTPTAAATYNVRIVVKDKNGTVSNKAIKITSTNLANNSTVSGTAMYVNSKLTVTGKASGGSKKGYTYSYYYKRSTNTNWSTIGTLNTTSTTAAVKPTAVAVYDVKVVVKDSAGTAAVKTFTVKVTNLTNKSTVSATSLKSTAALTITGKAANGLTPYKYAYYYKRTENTNWKTIGTEFGTDTKAVFKPGTAATFDVKVVIKDASGLKAEKTFKCKFS